MSVTGDPLHAEIWHNPSCSNARGALALLQEAGLTPVVVEYLRTPPTREALRAMIRDAGLSVRDAIRTKEPEFAALGLDAPGVDDEALLDAMCAHPRLINRPFVRTPLGARLCRPPERVREILPPA